MNKDKFTKNLGVVAGAILLIGILQMLLFIPSQITAIIDATAQGVSSKEISNYILQQMVPQILSYVILTLGFSFSILALRNICVKLGDCILDKADSRFKKESLIDKPHDDLFDDFEVVENDNDI